MKNRWLKRFSSVCAAALCIIFLATAKVASGEERHVHPGESIQAAIDASGDGDIIVVHPGVYEENIKCSGNNTITIKSTNPNDPDVVGTTIIDGSGKSDPGVVLFNPNGTYALSGFTVRNGGKNAIYGGATSVTITNCVITDNIENGIFFWDSGMEVTNCTITNNGFAGIYCDHCSLTATNCIICNNHYAGIYCYYSSPSITNCTISNNSRNNSGGRGGIYCWYKSSPTVTNCILWNNTPQEISLDNSTITVAYSDIQGGYAGTGNINEDPLFIDPGAGNYHLLGGSPCIDTGTNGGAPSTDRDGISRPQGSSCDMGAYEYAGTGACSKFALNDGGKHFDDNAEYTYELIEQDGESRAIAAYQKLADYLCLSAEKVTDPASPDYGKVKFTSSNGRAVLFETNQDHPNWVLVRDVAETFGWRVDWDDPTKTAIITPKFTLSKGGGGPDYVEHTYELIGDTGVVPYQNLANYLCLVAEQITDPASPDYGKVKFTDSNGKTKAFTPYLRPGDTKVWVGVREVAEYFDWSVDWDALTKIVTISPYVHVYPGQSIQAAITAAARGEVIAVHPWTYLENISFQGKAITVRSMDPGDPNVVAATIIDGKDIENVVTFDHAEGSGSVLSGVTVQNGNGFPGGGIYCKSSSPTITNCIVTHNTPSSDGGGIICVSSASPTIANCSITDNSVPEIGGGIFCASSSPVITNCSISNNTSYEGGGILCSSSSPIITNCLINNNTFHEGGGIYCYVSSPKITNCTITGNSISGPSGGHGGGIACFELSSPSITNCIFWNDSPVEIYLEASDPIVSYSDIKMADTGTKYPGIGNINADPLFVDPTGGDYHLLAESPCIDTGTDQNAPLTDKDGIARPQDGDGNGQPAWDMGAYEYFRLAAPVITSPTNGEHLNLDHNDLIIQWTGVQGAVKYWFGIRDLNTNEVLEEVPDIAAGETSYSYSIPFAEIIKGHKFRVAVGAFPPNTSDAQDASWAEVEFLVKLTAPKINYPANGASIAVYQIPSTGQWTPINVQWTAVQGAANYWLEVKEDGTGNLIVNKHDVSPNQTSYPISVNEPQEGGTYTISLAAAPPINTPVSADVSWAKAAKFTIKVNPPISGELSTESNSRRDTDKTDNETKVSDPVDTPSGAHLLERTLLSVNGIQPLSFRVRYNSLLLNEGPLGKGWGHDFEARLELLPDGNVLLHWTANRVNHFIDEGSGQFSSPDLATYFDTLVKNADGSYTLTRQDQTVYQFNASGQLVQRKNRYGQRLTMNYNAGGRLLAVTEPVSGQTLTLHYNADGLINAVSDNLSRQVTFSHDASHNLIRITNALGQSTTYTYNTDGQVLTATDAEGVRLFTDTYDDLGRVVTQDDARGDNQLTRFSYDESSHPGWVITTVTNRNGKTRLLTHDSSYQLLSLRDELGYTTTYTYDYAGNRTSSTDEGGNTTTFTYDDRGNPLTSTDPAGHITTMTYDERNNPLSTENTVGKKVVFTYDGNNNLTSVTDPLGNTTTYSYGTNGILLSETTPGSGTTTYTYQNGLLHTVTNPAGNTTTYGYDAVGRLVSITNASGKVTVMAYDAVDNLVSVADPLGNITRFTYNSHGDKLTETDPKGNITRFAYDNNGNLSSQIDALHHETRYEYDAEDRLLRMIDARGHATTFTYDNKGKLIGATDPLGHTRAVRYDAVGNIISQKDALGNQAIAISYDIVHNPVTVKDALGHTATNQYDALNRLIQAADPLRHITQFHYDDLNRLISTTDPLGGLARQSFDEDGNSVALIDPGNNQIGFSFDQARRLIAQTSGAGSHTTYGYNAQDLLAKVTNGRGQVTNYQYDDADRLISFIDPAGTVTYAYDDNGNVLTVTDSTGAIVREYDALDRVVKYTDSQGNAIRYTYDEVGNLIAITYPGGREVHYSYDAADQLASVTDWAGRVTTYEYDANGRMIRTKRSNSTVLTRTYDAAGQLIQQKDVDRSGRIITQYDYAYDAAGEITVEQPAVALQPFTTTKAVMAYTSDNRLATYNNQTVEYDAEGNMTSGPLAGATTGYTYDARNRLIIAGNTTYLYDAENNRIGITEGTQQTRYIINPQASLSQVLIRTDSQGKQTFYIYGLGLIGQEDAGGAYHAYDFDLRGSTIALTDEGGQVTDRFQYAPYGEMTYRSGATDTPFLYNGWYGVMTDSNGLYYMRARYYNPEIRRFVNRDVLLGSIDDSQSLNCYAYVNGNPVSYVDPFGLCPHDGDESILDKVGRALGTEYGDKAAKFWADQYVKTGNPAFLVPLSFAACWTPDTWIDTATTLIPWGKVAKVAQLGVGKVFPKAARWIGKPIEWWYRGAEKDIEWLKLTEEEKLYYEIGQNTLKNATYEALEHLDPVARGKEIVEMIGRWGKVKGLFTTYWPAITETAATGPTPLGRLISPPVIKGEIVYLRHKLESVWEDVENLWGYLQE